VDAVILEHRIVEVAQHRFVGRVVHGELVLRAAPQLRFRLMADGAGLAADECRRLDGFAPVRGEGRSDRATGQKLKRHADANERRDDQSCERELLFPRDAGGVTWRSLARRFVLPVAGRLPLGSTRRRRFASLACQCGRASGVPLARMEGLDQSASSR
jgi:hypothetical protein